MTPRIRVLVVDDSAFARKVVREALAADPATEVVGIARDGLEALERIAELRPDIIACDLVMPNLDGVGLLRSLPPAERSRVVLVSVSDKDSELGAEALALGAFDLVHKPTALATDRLHELAPELVDKVRAAAAARSARSASRDRGPPDRAPPDRVPPDRARPDRAPIRLIVVGTSTGGPAALVRLLAALPADLAAPMCVALHIPSGYTEALAARLDAGSPLRVVEAAESVALHPGLVVLARGGMHLKVEARGGALVARTDAYPLVAAHHPSVDVLFASAAAAVGPDALGVVMTGMGDDGVQGAAAIVAAGGLVLTEAERSCVVYGMPRAVVEAGLSAGEVPIHDLGAAVGELVSAARAVR